VNRREEVVWSGRQQRTGLDDLSVLPFPLLPQSGDGERLPVLHADIDRLLVPSVLVVGQFDLASIEWSPTFFKPFWRMTILPFVITFTLYAIPPFSFVLL
jgi:hypothetical protein